MTEPTREQIKEFIKSLGGEEAQSGVIRLLPDYGWHHISFWESQVKSLDFLFRYAVPKLYGKISAIEIVLPNNKSQSYDFNLTKSSKTNDYFGSRKDPALALFWAIWESIK